MKQYIANDILYQHENLYILKNPKTILVLFDETLTIDLSRASPSVELNKTTKTVTPVSQSSDKLAPFNNKFGSVQPIECLCFTEQQKALLTRPFPETLFALFRSGVGDME